MGASVTLTKPDASTGQDRLVDPSNPLGVALPPADSAALAAAKSNYSNVAGAYVSGTPRAPGTGILVSLTTGGTATLTFGGVDIPFTFAVGPTILPLAITKVVLGSAVGGFYAIS